LVFCVDLFIWRCSYEVIILVLQPFGKADHDRMVLIITEMTNV